MTNEQPKQQCRIRMVGPGVMGCYLLLNKEGL